VKVALDLREVSVSERGHQRLIGFVKELGHQTDSMLFELIADPLPNLTRYPWSAGTRIVSPQLRTRAVHHQRLGHLRRLIWGGAQVMHFLTGDVWQVPTCRTVVSLTGLAPLRDPGIFFSTKEEEIAYRDHLDTVFRVADRVVVPTEFSKREIHHHFPQSRGKLVHIPYGVDPAFFPEDWGVEDRSRFRLNIGSKRGFYLHTGGIDVLSGLDFLLEVYRIYRDRCSKPRKLVITGDPHRPHGGIPTLFEMVTQRGLLADVILVGQVSDDFLRRLYCSAALLVHPARGGSYGFAPLEAMACGCPVLCSDAGALPELIGDAASVIPVQDAEGWAERLINLTENKELRAGLVEKGMEHVKEFGWEKTAGEMIEVYKQVAESS